MSRTTMSATAAQGPSRSPAGTTISATPSISATMPATAARTTSAAAASCRHTTQYVGYSGTGTFTQTGGYQQQLPISISATTPAAAAPTTSAATASCRRLREYVGYSGTGTFTQTGGTNSIGYGTLYLGYNAGSSGTYNLSGSGQLSAAYASTSATSGTGTFTQSGGTNSIAQRHPLSRLQRRQQRHLQPQRQRPVVGRERIRRLHSGATALFQQTGGTNTVSGLSIGSGGMYLLAGGTLQVNGSLVNQGVFAGNGTPATLSAATASWISPAAPGRTWGPSR